jgi:hypothetical protein
MAVSGRNWGAAAVQGSTLTFSVGGRPAFRVPLKDVGGVQQAPQEARAAPRPARALQSSRGEQALPARALRAPGCVTVAHRGWGIPARPGGEGLAPLPASGALLGFDAGGLVPKDL